MGLQLYTNTMKTSKEYIDKLKKTLDSLDLDEIEDFTIALINAFENNCQIFIFGNGGSASTASHFACDINKGCSNGNEKRFKVISLTDNIPIMLAYANDVSYEDVFLEQLKNYLNIGDVVIGISGSGNSKNVLKAIEYSNQKGNVTIGITGFNGGLLKKLAKISVNANVNDMQISEDIHMIVVHILMKELFQYVRK